MCVDEGRRGEEVGEDAKDAERDGRRNAKEGERGKVKEAIIERVPMEMIRSIERRDQVLGQDVPGIDSSRGAIESRKRTFCRGLGELLRKRNGFTLRQRLDEPEGLRRGMSSCAESLSAKRCGGA
jgi:hypothetical protein